MATATQHLLTAEEFGRRPDSDHIEELVRGKIVTSPPPDARHGHVRAEVAYLIGRVLAEYDIGHVLGNSAVITRRDPDTVRNADLVFHSHNRLTRGLLHSEHVPGIPELVLEVLPSSDRWADHLIRVAEYLNAGVLTVALLDPKNCAAYLYWADISPAILGADDSLTFPEILPGFEVVVGRLFE